MNHERYEGHEKECMPRPHILAIPSPTSWWWTGMRTLPVGHYVEYCLSGLWFRGEAADWAVAVDRTIVDGGRRKREEGDQGFGSRDLVAAALTSWTDLSAQR